MASIARLGALIFILSVVPFLSVTGVAVGQTPAATPSDAGNYAWWRGERAKRLKELEDYLAERKEEFQSFKSAPMASKQGVFNLVGIPVMMFRLLPELFPDIWGPPAAKMASVGFGPDPFEPDSVMPLGIGHLPSHGFRMPITGEEIRVNYATLACMGCHAGAVNGPDGKIIRMVGAPTSIGSFFGLVHKTTTDPRFTVANFRNALNGKPPGWVYQNPAMLAQEKLERELFDLPGGALFFLEELKIFADGFAERIKLTLGTYTYGGPHAPPFGIPGSIDVFSVAAAAGTHPKRMTPDELKVALPLAPAPADIMATWRQADRAAFQWDNSFSLVSYREVAASLTVTALNPSAVNLKNVELASRFVQNLPPPPYPFDIDSQKARRGEAIYKAACHDCHRPNFTRLWKPSELGTDPNRANVVNNFVATTLTTLAREACTIPACFGPNGARLPDSAVLSAPAAYAALPLNGIWATAPYLHNGSVPTLYHLLTGDRPAKFYRANTTYDQKMVGFTWDKATNPQAVLLDTGWQGYANTGHAGPQFNGGIDWKSEPGKLEDLLEYLKTL